MNASAEPTGPEAGPPTIQAPPHPMLFVQSLKGAPASVLLALAITGRFMSHQELMLWTRCGHFQVTLALRLLQQLGWARSRTSRGPWALSEAQHLPVDFSFLHASALKALNDDDDSSSSTLEGTSSSSARREHLRKLLDQHGIEEPTATELAELPHMSEAYVEAHVQAARAKGLGIGVVIRRMRMGVRAPSPNTGPGRQADQAEKIRRFKEGI